MTRSLGARSKLYRPTAPRAVYQRSGAPVVAPNTECITESFNQVADWPVGPVQTWDQGGQAFRSHRPSTTTIFGAWVDGGDGSDPTTRTLHIVDGAVTVKAPDDSNLPDAEWHYERVHGFARAQQGLGTADMRVSATIAGTPTTTPTSYPHFAGDYVLIARSFAHPDEDMGTYVPGYNAYFEDDYIYIGVVYIDSNDNLNECTFLDTGGSWTHTLVPGDEIALEATGTGSSTRVVCSVNGVTALDLDATQIASMLCLGDSIAYAPEGDQAGFGIQTYGESQDLANETFNKADGTPIGPLLTWDSFLPHGCDTIDTNRYHVNHNYPDGSARGAIVMVDEVGVLDDYQRRFVNFDSAGSPGNNTTWTILAFVDGTDYTDWSGVGMMARWTNPNGYDFYFGELAAGDDSGFLTNLTHVAGPFGMGSFSNFDLQVIAPLGGGTGSYSFKATGIGVTTWTTVTLNGGTGHRSGVMLRANSGDTAPYVTQTQTWPSFNNFWIRDELDDRTVLDNWQACIL